MTNEMKLAEEIEKTEPEVMKIMNLAATEFDPAYSLKLRLSVKTGVDEEGDSIFSYVEHKVRIPRFGTDGMLNYQERINLKYGPILLEKDEDKRARMLLNAGLTEGWAARQVIELITGPKFLKILHPQDYKKLSAKVLEVEKEILDPQIVKLMEVMTRSLDDSKETPSHP